MRSPKVLLVNDDSASLLALTSLLTYAGEESGYEVVVARSGEEALRHVLNHDFAVILLDVNMPGMDGFETAEAIHSHPRSASVPIIFVTAHYADEMHKLKGYQKGAVDYLFTPIIPKILQTKVAVFVELAKKNLQLQHQTEQLAQLNSDLQKQRQLDLQNINERKLAEQALRQSREELRQLASYQDRIKEEERKRIAREIHDELGQNLLALRIDVSMLHSRTKESHPKLNRRVQAMLEQIDSTMKSMRAIINNLRPVVLDLGLNAAIEWQVKEFQRRSGIPCTLSMDEEELVLDDNRATALFRILQESLNNILRHAQATRAWVELLEDGSTLSMKIADNGIGMQMVNRKKTNSFGLVGMKERIANLGGDLVIDSAENQGTAIRVTIPFNTAGTSLPEPQPTPDGAPDKPALKLEPLAALKPEIKPAPAVRRKRERTSKESNVA
ncbi:Histidine kinase-, DNA gyrase B-, and HSP90-like ATPase [Noviherbaspirillum humi]|uniref:Histidine kinase-, DNA gyrase B-, and HSP90-like ATPase n=1 Tax=Noviherbaspirillum humi TaxID=1688639 RepID=A0A239GIW4_9BURK|nr:response regulator [Noviherbaspirillum humi]SNS69107.1 Histidine kinase-, DNA gyrase B-, and HSP90-like ATPase [Noviherbaspirillum humi]